VRLRRIENPRRENRSSSGTGKNRRKTGGEVKESPKLKEQGWCSNCARDKKMLCRCGEGYKNGVEQRLTVRCVCMSMQSRHCHEVSCPWKPKKESISGDSFPVRVPICITHCSGLRLVSQEGINRARSVCFFGQGCLASFHERRNTERRKATWSGHAVLHARDWICSIIIERGFPLLLSHPRAS